jgi:ABC-type branched-subunit amino acid transport system ATPase component
MKFTSEANRVAPIFASVDVRAGYSDIVIVDGVSLEVEAGEIVAIVGPNGSGKSTLLKSFFGFSQFLGGKMYYRGEDITGKTADRMIASGIGYIPQTNNVFANLTITENLQMGAYTRSDRSRIAAEIEDIFEIFHELKHRAKPSVLMLDEPLASLSPKSVEGILSKLTLVQESGTALVMIEQNVKRALSFANRAYILVEGKCIMQGPANALLNDELAKKRYLGLET